MSSFWTPRRRSGSTVMPMERGFSSPCFCRFWCSTPTRRFSCRRLLQRRPRHRSRCQAHQRRNRPAQPSRRLRRPPRRPTAVRASTGNRARRRRRTRNHRRDRNGGGDAVEQGRAHSPLAPQGVSRQRRRAGGPRSLGPARRSADPVFAAGGRRADHPAAEHGSVSRLGRCRRPRRCADERSGGGLRIRGRLGTSRAERAAVRPPSTTSSRFPRRSSATAWR